MPGPTRPRQFEQIERAIDVGFGVQLWLAQRWPHTGPGREMNDAVKSFGKGTLECFRIANIGFDNFKLWILGVRADVISLDRRLIKIVKVIDDRDLPIAFAQEAIDQMGTDKPGAAGD